MADNDAFPEAFGPARPQRLRDEGRADVDRNSDEVGPVPPVDHLSRGSLPISDARQSVGLPDKASDGGSAGGRSRQSAYPADEEARKAVALAYALLARRSYSRRELQQKLKAKLEDPVLIDTTLQWLEARNLLDDQKLAEQAVQFGIDHKGWGRRKLQQWLHGRGIDSNTAATAVASIDPENEETQAQALAERQRSRGKRPDQVFRFLVNRGYPSGVARRASLQHDEE